MRNAVLALLCYCAVMPLAGQQVTGSINGIVADTSGATIPQADVSMINELSGDIRRTKTNSDGYFSIVGVMPGSYTVLIESQGFNSYRIAGIKFTAGDTRSLGQVTLPIGTTTEEVTVSATLTHLTAIDSGEKSVVLTSKQFEDLPSVGRSALEYMKVLPGVVDVNNSLANRPAMNGENIGIDGNGMAGPQSGMGWMSANGMARRAIEITADGANTSDPGCNCSTPVNPNPEMIAEMKVQQSNFSAENAKGPVVVGSITKAGGREFHGSTYFRARHFALNSNDSFNNAHGAPEPENRYFFPGGTLGGPVLLPGTSFNRNRDKLFFFAGFEYFAQRIDSGLLRAIVPTVAMKGGDFSDTATLSAFNRVNQNAGRSIANTYPGSIIPRSQLDPGTSALLRLLPEPNADPAGLGNGFNWIQQYQGDQNMTQFLLRMDYSISDYTKLFVRYNRQALKQPVPVEWWCCQSGVVPMPTSITNPTRSESIAANFTKVFGATLTNETVFGWTFQDAPAYYDDPNAVLRSTIGYPYQGTFKADPKFPSFTAGADIGNLLVRGLHPTWFTTKHLPSVSNTTTKIAGTHTLKLGGYWSYIINKGAPGGLAMTQITFGTGHGLTTGNLLADMATGVASAYSESTQPFVRDQGWAEVAGFVQDSWKVRPNLTLEFGLRVQHMQPWTPRNNLGRATWVQSEYSTTAPYEDLPGVSWHARNSDVPRAGWATRNAFWAPRAGFAWDIFSRGRTVLRGGYGTFNAHDFAVGGDAMDLPAGVRRFTQTGGMHVRDMDSVVTEGSLAFGGAVADSTDNRQPVTKSWSLTLSQRLAGETFFEVSYVGNKSTNLLDIAALNDINVIPLGAMIDNPTGRVDDYRPMRQYGALTSISHNSYSNYHALQTLLSRQIGRLRLTASYSWSKAMGIQGSVDRLNIDNNYGPLDIDRTHAFYTTYALDVPNFAKNETNAFIKGIANDWKISGITRWNSGINLQPASGYNFRMNYRMPGLNRTLGSTDVVGTPYITAMPILTCDPREGLSKGQYVNGSCFVPPVPGGDGQLGFNGAVKMPYMSGPSFFQSDLSIFKNFRISESKMLQFSASGFNFLNHPVRSFVSNDQNLLLQFDAQGKVQNPRFGFADYEMGKRIIALGVRFQF